MTDGKRRMLISERKLRKSASRPFLAAQVLLRWPFEVLVRVRWRLAHTGSKDPNKREATAMIQARGPQSDNCRDRSHSTGPPCGVGDQHLDSEAGAPAKLRRCFFSRRWHYRGYLRSPGLYRDRCRVSLPGQRISSWVSPGGHGKPGYSRSLLLAHCTFIASIFLATGVLLHALHQGRKVQIQVPGFVIGGPHFGGGCRNCNSSVAPPTPNT